MSFEAFLSELAQIERLRPHTVRAYRYELAAAAIDARFRRPLDEVQLADLEAWLARPPAATSTVGRRVATFRRYFVWAGRHGLCGRNPLAERAPLRGRRRLPRPIREQHEQRALDAALNTAPPPYRLIFTLLSETGMRVGEVLGLRWGDVILESGREARRAVGRTPADHDMVFRSNRGTRISYDVLHYQWAKLCRAGELLDPTGAPRDTPHQLRHTRGSGLIAQGQSVKIVQRVLGHRDIRSTLGCAELQGAHPRAALERPPPR